MEPSRDISRRQLDPRREQAISLLVAGVRGKDAAEKLGIRPETLSRWKSEYGFQRELQRVQSELRQARMARLGSVYDKAIDKLEGLLESDSERIVLRSAGTITQTASKVSSDQPPDVAQPTLSEAECKAELSRIKREIVLKAIEAGEFSEEEEALVRRAVERY